MNTAARETVVRIPGDKSISHRAVLLASIADGTSRLRSLPGGKDVRSSLDCIRALGIRTTDHGEELLIHGKGFDGLRAPGVDLDCGNSGTTMRLLAGILAGQPFASRLTGDGSLRRRPMERIMEPLGRMGAAFPEHDSGRAPFTIKGRRPLRPIIHTLPVASAQVKSAVLFAGLFADGETVVNEPQRTRDHTERMMGLVPEREGTEWSVRLVPPGRVDPVDMAVPGDPSSAAFIVLAAMVCGSGPVLLKHVSTNPTRTAYLDHLRRLGAALTVGPEAEAAGEPYADLRVSPGHLHGEMVVDSHIPDVIDEIPALAVGCMCLGVPFTVRHASELRHKESDRISLLVANLRAIGCEVEEYADGFASRAKNGLIGASITTHGDHRIAMAFGIAACAVPDIVIDDPACADVSFPGFWDVLRDLRG